MHHSSLFTSRVSSLIAVLLLGSPFTRAADQVAVLNPPVIQGEPLGVTIDKSGVRYVAGRFMGTVDFNPGMGEDSKTSGGGFDVFVTRFEKDGSYGWTRTFGGSLIDFPKSILLLGKTLYIGGTFASTNAGVGGTGTVVCKGLRDVFVWAMDATTGNSIPTFGTAGFQTFGGAGTDSLQAMIPFRTNLVLAGNFDSTDAGVGGTGTIGAAHALDCYALMINAKSGLADPKFGTDGAVAFGGADVDEVGGLAVAGSTLYVTGNFKSADFTYESTLLFGPIGIRSAYVLAINTKDGTLNTKFNTFGALRFGGSSDDRGLKLAVSGTTLFLAGNLLSSNARLNGVGVSFTSSGMNDAYVLALSTKDGTLKPTFGNGGLKKFGGTMEDTLAGLIATPTALYLAGTFESENVPVLVGMQALHVAKKDIFVMTLTAKDGQLLYLSKKAFGFSIFGGSEDETATDLAMTKKILYVTGTFNSTNAGCCGTGPYNFTNFGGLILPFDLQTGLLPVP